MLYKNSDEMEVKNIRLSKILKLELPELVGEVVRIVEKHNPDHLGLRGIQDLLKNDQQQIKQLKLTPTSYPLTEKVQLLREREFKCVGAIVSHMSFIVRANIKSMVSAAIVANPVVKTYLSGLRKNNESVVNEIIYQFLEHLDTHPEVYDALSDLGLSVFVDEIRKLNAQKIVLIVKRDEYVLKSKPEVNSRAVQKKARYNLNLMFGVINSLNAYKDKPNFDPLIRELNVLLTRYEIIINMRKAHNEGGSAPKVI